MVRCRLLFIAYGGAGGFWLRHDLIYLLPPKYTYDSSLTVNWRQFSIVPLKTLLAATDQPPFIENHVNPIPHPLPLKKRKKEKKRKINRPSPGDK